MHKGTVIKSTGNWYQVRLEDDSVIRCRIVGKFRLEGKKLTNPVAVGDEVQIKIEAADETGIIQTILDRKNYVARQSPRKKHHIHLLASNVDQAIVIATVVAPKLKQGFIDRFLLMTEPYRIPTTIVFNKSDVYQAADMELYDYLKQMYEVIGYQVLVTSAFSGEGLEQLKHTLKDQQTLLSGQSGVGKSSLVNAIQPQLELRTGEISDFSGKGQHTTTFAEMYPLDFGGTIIDTPGIKTLSFNNLEPMDIAHNFREIFDYAKDCKFANCMHRDEPKCAVKAAVETEAISELRYINYLTILEEAEEQNYWERRAM
ncbi:MAG: ribosome small subunit-dependent GTPase A [Bacteroidota bacterium]